MKPPVDQPLDNDQLISPTAARGIYRRLIGERLKMDVFDQALVISPHLAYWSNPSPDMPRVLLGIRKKRWIYFIKTRAVLNGGKNIFSSTSLIFQDNEEMLHRNIQPKKRAGRSDTPGPKKSEEAL